MTTSEDDEDRAGRREDKNELNHPNLAGITKPESRNPNKITNPLGVDLWSGPLEWTFGVVPLLNP